jgi:methyltransferase (TIGR00027 family)
VVLLGAGFDSRAYRFRDTAPGIRFFEVDLPELQKEKKAKVAALLGSLPENVTYVPIDFNSQQLEGVLRKAGYENTIPTFFNWEGADYFCIFPHCRPGRWP